MKKLTRLLLPILMLLTLCACDQSGSIPAKSAEAAWQEQYDLGIKYLNEGNYEEAVVAFTAAIEIDPKQAEAYMSLADAYIGQGDPDAAQKALENGIAATGDERLQSRLEAKTQETDDAEIISDDGNTELTVSGETFTVSLTDPNLQSSYSVNRPETPDNDRECAWLIGFTDGTNRYEVGTSHFKSAGDEPQSMTLQEMQSDIWILNEHSAKSIGAASLSISGTTMTWSFTVPVEYSFNAAAMEFTGNTIEVFPER